jgi:DNA polymerase-3 subunit alpha
MSCDLHRHDEHSTFDGFGKPAQLAALAKSKGLTALGLANHGNTSGLVEHYFACKEAGIKPILGVEGYFQPSFDKERERFHICLFAKSLKGYENINAMMTAANKESFYYKPVITYKLMEQYSEDVICTSACIHGPISWYISKGNIKLAHKLTKRFVDIFEDDFYLEIQPYKLREEGVQEKVNIDLLNLGKVLGIKCILTSDSHYGNLDEFDSYLKMHEIAGTKYDVGSTYYERYMPTDMDLEKRFVKMHSDMFTSVDGAKQSAMKLRKNLKSLVDSVDDEILELLPLEIPKVHDGHEEVSSKKKLQQEIVKGLKKKGLYDKWRNGQSYLARCKEEFDVIVHHGFEDYFLIVQDYINFAKEQGIAVGPGRGSVCNCEVAFVLGITDVDSLYFGMDYTRFLRKDKKKLPDIDLDFETERRHEVIEYLINKYPTQSVQICSYGLYKVDNLLNDLFKVCGLADDKTEQAVIKQFVKKFVNVEGTLDMEALLESSMTAKFNKKYDNVMKHFSLMYKKIRYVGTHAAGVAIVGSDITKYTAIRKAGDKFNSVYDLNDLERINAIKFDILGLKTMSIIKELQDVTGEIFSYDWFKDQEVYKLFREGKTLGIFQFERPAVQSMLQLISADCFEDIVAVNALNRPGPLSLGMPQQYAANKQNPELSKDSAYWEYTKTTYGTVIFQEQISAICRGIGNMSWSDSDRVLKFMKGVQMTERAIKAQAEEEAYLKEEFVKGCVVHKLSMQEALELFEKITVYSFNKGHAVGYAIIAFILMWYKVHYPVQFYYTIMKYASGDDMLAKYKIEAVKLGNVIMLPHVNGTAKYSISNRLGEEALQEGMENIKNVGAKAAIAIQEERIKNGSYTSEEDLVSRIPKRVVNKKTLDALRDAGALDFNKKRYIERIVKYNSTLFARGD